MRLLRAPSLSSSTACPYLEGREFVQEYFFARDMTLEDMGVLIQAGWRRFGNFFFQPRCPQCQSCVPVRVDVGALMHTKGAKRLLRKGQHITMELHSPRCTDEVWEVYAAHSKFRFGKEPEREDFEQSFFSQEAPSLQSEYRLHGTLLGVGFLDLVPDGASSAYFAYNQEGSQYSLGSFSVYRECEAIKEAGGHWYYLGYKVMGCSAMEYKGRFLPQQEMNWATGAWSFPKESS